MPINHLNPPTGHMADNVIGFARALRAATEPDPRASDTVPSTKGSL